MVREIISHLREHRPSVRSLIFGFVIAAAAFWSSGLLWSRDIQEATMRRFHLSTNSYVAWVLQQPVPSMYNLANESHLGVGDLGWDILTLGKQRIKHEWVNHFPPRTVTFFESINFAGLTGTGAWTSRYRGRKLETLCRIRSLAGGGLSIKVLEERLDGKVQQVAP